MKMAKSPEKVDTVIRGWHFDIAIPIMYNVYILIECKNEARLWLEINIPKRLLKKY